MTAFTVLNAARKAAGVPKLRADAELRKIAKSRAADLLARGSLQHEGGAYAEVLACGKLDEQQVIREWLGSPPHHAVVLSAAYTHGAVVGQTDARGRTWWVGVFR